MQDWVLVTKGVSLNSLWRADPRGCPRQLRLPDTQAAGQPRRVRQLCGEPQLHRVLHLPRPLHCVRHPAEDCAGWAWPERCFAKLFINPISFDSTNSYALWYTSLFSFHCLFTLCSKYIKAYLLITRVTMSWYSPFFDQSSRNIDYKDLEKGGCNWHSSWEMTKSCELFHRRLPKKTYRRLPKKTTYCSHFSSKKGTKSSLTAFCVKSWGFFPGK